MTFSPFLANDVNSHKNNQVIDIMTSMEDLRECDLRGNAVRRKPKYFEKVVTR